MERLSSEDREAVGRLQALVRVPSVSGNGVRSGSYAKVVKVLQKHCHLAGLTTEIVEITPGLHQCHAMDKVHQCIVQESQSCWQQRLDRI